MFHKIHQKWCSVRAQSKNVALTLFGCLLFPYLSIIIIITVIIIVTIIIIALFKVGV